jgi:cytochrome c oxidase assembly protein subunit 15
MGFHLLQFPILMAQALNSAPTPYNRVYHWFVVSAACCTLLLIVAGALVTSNDAGLAVPDWPTSFGSLYRIPPMVGGVRFEHSHRMVAEFVGLLTIIVAVWTSRVERRKWMRVLGWVALATVIMQGILGGITVKFFLPPWVSTAHATLAQTFFCIIVSMALFTARDWVTSETPASEMRTSAAPASYEHRILRHTTSRWPGVRTLTALTVAAVYVQLILGAAFRHSGMKLLPHLISAAIVTILILWTVTRTLSEFPTVPQLRRPATFLLGLLSVQLSLGFAAYLTRVEWGTDAPQPMFNMVASTVAHVAVGAVVLATTVVLAIQARRSIAPAEQETAAYHDVRKAATA